MAKPRGFSSGFSPGFGVGKYYYGFQQYHWEVSPTTGVGCWMLPPSVVGRVDLRPLPSQGESGGTPQGFAFVASMQPIDVLISRSLHFSDENVTGAMRDAWEAELGYRPEGDKVVDLLWDMLTGGADPTGQAACKPLVPGVDGVFKLRVGGHSLVKSERFDPNSVAGRKCLDLLKRDYRRIRQESRDGRHLLGAIVNDQHYRKVLGSWVRKYKLPHRAFQPSDLPDESPIEPTTTLTESFNTGDTTTLGPDQTWTEEVGVYAVVSNTVDCDSDGVFTYARVDADLSSDDHYCKIDNTQQGDVGTDWRVGVICRKDGTATVDYYFAGLWADIYARRDKMVGGSLSNLDFDAVTYSAPTKLKLICDGSDQTVEVDDVAVSAGTDTAITGNLRCGIANLNPTLGLTNNPRGDAWEAGDLAAPPPAGNRRRRLLMGAA